MSPLIAAIDVLGVAAQGIFYVSCLYIFLIGYYQVTRGITFPISARVRRAAPWVLIISLLLRYGCEYVVEYWG